MWVKVIVAIGLLVAAVSAFGITIEKSAYRDVVIELQDTVPMDQCAQVLNDLEVSFPIYQSFSFCKRLLSTGVDDISKCLEREMGGLSALVGRPIIAVALPAKCCWMGK